MKRDTRINVVFDQDTVDLLGYLAFKKSKSLANLVRELTLEALDFREDLYLSKFTEKLDQQGSKIYSHDEAWN